MSVLSTRLTDRVRFHQRLREEQMRLAASRMWVNERLREEQARYTPGVPTPVGRSTSRAAIRKVR